MNKAKVVMFFFALAAILSMLSMGISVSLIFMTGDKYETTGFISTIVGFVVMCAIFDFAFKTKRKFREQGLL
ncbi:hypothetical protein DCE79_03680 [Lysinibacillus sp. 2017]|uniref:DUF5325 family protein n=1 Tax=unclassified Lysinibacillus TaxID=2636778 RepID=UPI000D528337|nr:MULTISPECIES: DUF5325 family protein [unclassified Lysinibacillus]AWE06537.1 hypothetical protein DCE79_03680 [Lysinibacillus sp. 2017]TGN35426.1 hypothetical protein E4L99_10295 [Lysinibacillus sp. S2017]